MLYDIANGQTSVILRIKLRKADTAQGITALTSSSTGLIISTIADNEATPTYYTSAASKIESVTGTGTLGVYAAPTSTKCRFEKIDDTYHPGLYELQLANARFAVSNAKELTITISGVANLAECDVKIPLRAVNPYDAVRGGMTALPNAAAEAAGGLYTRGTGAGQINQAANGQIDTNTAKINGVSTGSVTTIGAYLGNATAALVVDGSGRVQVQSGTSAGQISLTSGLVTLAAVTHTGAVIPTVTTVGTLTTYTNNTPQTGDSYAVVNNATYGNAKLVRATVPATTLDTASVAQTGDGYLRLGAPAGASHSADVAAVKADTAAVKVKTDYLPSVTAGAAGGVFIAGTNAATTITTALTTTFTGNLTGSVASVTGLTASDVGAIKTKTDYLPSATAGAAGGVFIAGTNAATTITTGLTTTFTGNLTGNVGGSVATLGTLPAIPANWITTAGITDGAITAAKTSGLATPTNITAASGVALSATTGWGGSALPTFASGSSIASLILADPTHPLATDTSGYAKVSSGTGAGQISLASGLVSVGTLPTMPTDWVTAAGLKADAASEIAAATADLATSGHTTSGTFGAAWVAAGGAGDPWSTSLPGSYGAGTAGYIIGHNIDAAVSTRSTYAGGAVASVTGAVGSVTGNVGGNVTGSVGSVTGNVGGSVASVTGAVTVSLVQALSAARAVDTVADTALTLNDAFHAALAGAAGKESVSGTTYLVKTPYTGTVIRTFTLDSGSAPTSRS